MRLILRNVVVCCLLLEAAGLQYSSMWSVTTTDDTAQSSSSLTFSLGDLTQIELNAEAGVKALYPIHWTVAQDHLCYAPVPHTQTTPNGTFGCVTLDPDYENKWKTQFAQLKQSKAFQSGHVIGIFLGDEHLYFGVKMSEVKLISDLIRRDWPEAIIYLNEAPGQCCPQVTHDYIGPTLFPFTRFDFVCQMLPCAITARTTRASLQRENACL